MAIQGEIRSNRKSFSVDDEKTTNIYLSAALEIQSIIKRINKIFLSLNNVDRKNAFYNCLRKWSLNAIGR